MSAGIFGLPPTAWYPLFAITLLALQLIIIPRVHIRALFLESLLWGFAFSLVFAASITALRFYRYEHMGPFRFLGSPIWLNLAWASGIMIVLYLEPPMKRRFAFWTYLAIVALLSAILDAVFHNLGLLTYFWWSPLHRFVFGFFWFLGASIFHQKYMSWYRWREANEQ